MNFDEQTLNAWATNASVNGFDDNQIAHAKATLALFKQRDALRAALEAITDDTWYTSGFVPADDEQARRAVLMNRINDIRAIAKKALGKQ